MAFSNKEHKKDKKDKKRHTRGKEFVNSWFRRYPCACGETNINKLTFHHLDPYQKLFSIDSSNFHYSPKYIEAEIKKCVVKCKNCHEQIHHGDSSEKEYKLINRYIVCPNKRIGRLRYKLSLWQIKKNSYCQKCHTSDASVLMCHHIDSTQKTYKMSQICNHSMDKFNKELFKIIFLCHNCHSEFHYLYGNITNQTQLEQYLGKKVISLKVDIRDYQSVVDQKISEYYNLSFLIT